MFSIEVKKALRGLDGGITSLSNKAALNILATAASAARSKEVNGLVDAIQESKGLNQVALAQAASAARIAVLDEIIKVCGGEKQ